jgi:sec-independent protein translocase protein TatA
MKFGIWELVIILVIVLLFWGAPKLPGLAKSLAQSLKIFQKEIKNPAESAKPAEPTEDTKNNEK